MIKYLFFLQLLLIGLSCNSANNELDSTIDKVLEVSYGSDSTASLKIFPYSIEKSDRVLILPRSLNEISALSYDNRNQNLIAVADEIGVFYRIAPEDGSIISKTKFANSGDFEGIELINGDVYILKSNGHIYRFNTEKEVNLNKINTPLNQYNDVEGLGYDIKTNQLILACKGAASVKGGKKSKSLKACYAYDLNLSLMIPEPVCLLSDSILISFVEKNHSMEGLSKAKVKKLKSRVKSFSPSAVGVHPNSGDYYILSSVGKLMVIVGKHSSILHIEYLNSDIHYQPEGICFSDDGTMFISNEAKGLVAKIFTYKMKK